MRHQGAHTTKSKKPAPVVVEAKHPSREKGELRSIGGSASDERLPRVEPAGGICASEPEVADDPERDCRRPSWAAHDRVR